MDLVKLEEKLSGIFFLIGGVLLFLIGSFGTNVEVRLVQIISSILIFPLVLLGVYAITDIRTSVSRHLEKFRKKIKKEISIKRGKIARTNLDKQIRIEEEILEKLRMLSQFKDSRIVSNIAHQLSSSVCYLNK